MFAAERVNQNIFKPSSADGGGRADAGGGGNKAGDGDQGELMDHGVFPVSAAAAILWMRPEPWMLVSSCLGLVCRFTSPEPAM